MSARLLTDPENRRHDICLPWIPFRNSRDGRFSDADFLFFSDAFGLSSKTKIDCDEERETRKDNSAAFPHHFFNQFPFKHCVKREDLIRVSGIEYAVGKQD
jgi:hypothetical protein